MLDLPSASCEVHEQFTPHTRWVAASSPSGSHETMSEKNWNQCDDDDEDELPITLMGTRTIPEPRFGGGNFALRSTAEAHSPTLGGSGPVLLASAHRGRPSAPPRAPTRRT